MCFHIFFYVFSLWFAWFINNFTFNKEFKDCSNINRNFCCIKNVIKKHSKLNTYYTIIKKKHILINKKYVNFKRNLFLKKIIKDKDRNKFLYMNLINKNLEYNLTKNSKIGNLRLTTYKQIKLTSKKLKNTCSKNISSMSLNSSFYNKKKHYNKKKYCYLKSGSNRQISTYNSFHKVQNTIHDIVKTYTNNSLNKKKISTYIKESISWYWPTNGKIVDNFSLLKDGNKGIDIAGIKGQSILAAANGKVVYVGNDLEGYGNLIIIKHCNNYLSTYAHNDVLLVNKQQQVKALQRIATMGNTGTNINKLHFEIRYKGKSINPLICLPKY